ncbi:MAG TPA: SEC-C domain-containing protein [Candidatus Copromorpha excrementigallinarum]|uniref:SEC-C domain-containing protein n=1 Tax=Candidatus Allocopromorpha excrementigallinarum TaxID=2840742 RepID=A0A9D1HZ52_9FIRM|nr:SEC-C domain-containing protein [Candidatus Copromorpha excrementigallinarum]
MTLFEQWRELIENQTEDTFREFWEEYSEAEKKIYGSILDDPGKKVTGKLGELSQSYQVRPVIFMGFLDGVNSSLKKENDFENFDEDSQVEIEIDPEKLFYNMLAADADHLYSLPQWLSILGEEKIKEITKAYKKSKTVVKGKKTGRNDPCPCGSGRKYKHCCGRNA